MCAMNAWQSIPMIGCRICMLLQVLQGHHVMLFVKPQGNSTLD
jgi:hypothetical protein